MLCPRCGHSNELLAHCLWMCQAAVQVWCHILKIFEKSKAHLMVSWGLAAWASFSREVEHFDLSRVGHKIRIYNGLSIVMHPFDDGWVQPEEKFLPLWELLSSLTLWVIWKARNIALFDSKQTPHVESIQEFCSDLILTLKGQFDAFQGPPESVERQ